MKNLSVPTRPVRRQGRAQVGDKVGDTVFGLGYANTQSGAKSFAGSGRMEGV